MRTFINVRLRRDGNAAVAGRSISKPACDASGPVQRKAAADGQDPQCHKQPKFLTPLDRPPYAAFDLTPGNGAIFATMTFGGLDTLPTGEVLRQDRSVIPGLFAAGRTSAGLPRCAAGYASGMSIGDATFFGRLAGLGAAQRASRVVPT